MKPEIDQRLKVERIQDRLLELPGWQSVQTRSEAFEWRQTFSSFNSIVEILVEIAMMVERFGREPEVEVQGNGLTLRLGTGGLEDADVEMAEAICNFC